MEDTMITPFTGRMSGEFDRERSVFIDQDKTNYLNKILRGEISAVEAYEQAIPTFEKERDKFLLSEIKNDHVRNIGILKALVEHSLSEPDENSGPWGTVVTTIMGAAKLVSNTATLKVLQEGEEHGLKEYQEALKFSLTTEEYETIALDFMPTTKRHIASLDRLIKNQNDPVMDKR